MRLLPRRSALVIAVAVCALVLPAAPAHADAEVERLDCTGDIAPSGFLFDPNYTTTIGTISCSKTHYGTLGFPDGGFSSPLEVHMSNWPTAPGVYESFGYLYFWVDGVKWIVVLAHHTSVLGVMLLGVTDPLGAEDRVGPDSGAPFMYHIRYGKMQDWAPGCAYGLCKEASLSFTAEYLHDLPVAA